MSGASSADSDIQLAGDSDLKLEPDSGVGLAEDDDGSDVTVSDVNLAGMADSDVALAADEMGSDVRNWCRAIPTPPTLSPIPTFWPTIRADSRREPPTPAGSTRQRQQRRTRPGR